MEKILNNLYVHTIESIIKQDFAVLDENLKMIKYIYETILSNSKQPNDSSLKKNLEKYVDDIGVRMIDSQLYDKTFKMLNELYEICNEHNKLNIYTNLYLQNTMRKIILSIQELASYRFIREFPMRKLMTNMLINAADYKGYMHDNNLAGICSAYYSNVVKNKVLTDDEKLELIKNLYKININLMSQPHISQNKEKVEILHRIILSLFKSIIDRGDTKHFNFLIQEIYSEINYINNTNTYEIFLVLAIYLYYLAFKETEKIVPENRKKVYINYIKDHKVKFLYIFERYYIQLWDIYKKINGQLNTWENYSEGEGKWLIMDNVVREFFLFLSMATNSFDVDRIFNDSNRIEELDIVLFLNQINNEDDLKVAYSIFKDIFGFNDLIENAEVDKMKDQIIMKYKDIHFNKLKKLKNNKEIIEKNKINIKKLINEVIDTNVYLRELKEKNNANFQDKLKDTLSNNKRIPYKMMLPIQFIAENVENNYEFITKHFKNDIELGITELFKKQLEYKKLSYSEKNKIKILFEEISSREANNINIDTIISGISIDSYLLYLEDEQAKNDLRKLINDVNYYEEINQRIWVGLDSRYIKSIVTDFKCNVRELNSDEVKRLLDEKREGNLYKINIFNDMHILLTKEEAEEYIKLESMIVQIDLSLNISMHSPKTGFVIEIKSKFD